MNITAALLISEATDAAANGATTADKAFDLAAVFLRDEARADGEPFDAVGAAHSYIDAREGFNTYLARDDDAFFSPLPAQLAGFGTWWTTNGWTD